VLNGLKGAAAGLGLPLDGGSLPVPLFFPRQFEVCEAVTRD
jgi:hypothetical protein